VIEREDVKAAFNLIEECYQQLGIEDGSIIVMDKLVQTMEILQEMSEESVDVEDDEDA